MLSQEPKDGDFIRYVDALQAEGYVFLTVEELFQQFGTQPQNGVLYASATEERNW